MDGCSLSNIVHCECLGDKGSDVFTIYFIVGNILAIHH